MAIFPVWSEQSPLFSSVLHTKIPSRLEILPLGQIQEALMPMTRYSVIGFLSPSLITVDSNDSNVVNHHASPRSHLKQLPASPVLSPLAPFVKQ